MDALSGLDTSLELSVPCLGLDLGQASNISYLTCICQRRFLLFLFSFRRKRV